MDKRCFLVIFLIVCLQHLKFCQLQSMEQENIILTHKTHYKKIEGLSEQISLLRYEVEAMDNETNPDHRGRMGIWLNSLEVKVLNERQRAESRLEKSQKQLYEAINEENALKILKKIDSSQARIQACQDLLMILDQLKIKLTEQDQPQDCLSTIFKSHRISHKIYSNTIFLFREGSLLC